ncbi:hypothetical protein GGI14_001918 [Coemansia sp. S680]|nr:hypothetical protein GGI14_001918 [Coemansia sp. S680]
MAGQQTILEQPAEETVAKGRRKRGYTFDYSFWTAGDTSSPKYASQEVVFEDIGQAVLKHALSGYHCCVFAYGQTGSGKSYTMMGTSEDAGLIPRICEQLFASMSSSADYHVEVSYLEIYNERVRDLLNPGSSGKNLRVREHPALGPYVEDLTMAAVSSYAEIFAHMSQGNKARTVAATNMNEASSRSHAVFTITLTMRTHSSEGVSERVSRIRLVDLAGSERASSTLATGARLKEGAKINQSLAALGKVISALADQAKHHSAEFVPYRDSVLTWLLKDSLGGNSRTFMIATISPADFSETLSTLRYADRAKHIVNQATVNEDATVRLVRELKEEVAGLRHRLLLAGGDSKGGDLEDQLRANEKLMAELNQTWEQKLARTQAVQADRERALAALGISIDTNSAGLGVGLHAPRDTPHLVNLSEDPLMSECLVYNLKPGHTTVGSGDDVDIRLSASGGVAPRHCYFEYCEEGGGVAVHPIDRALVLVNGRPIGLPRVLRSGYRVIIGTSFVFRFNHPPQARQELLFSAEQDTAQSSAPSSDSLPELESSAADWHYAWHEAHPDHASTLASSEFNPVPDYSPSLWSDSMSEFSDYADSAPSATAAPRSVAAVSIAGGSSNTKLSASLRSRAMSLSQQHQLQQRRQRRNSAIVAAPEDHSASYDPRRARGQTVTGLQNAVAIVETDEQQLVEKRLARLVARQWRRYKLMKVGQTMLQNAIHLKEANVISKELGQKAVYQFAILRGGGAEGFPVSPLEPDALPALLSDWDSISLGNRVERIRTLCCPTPESSVPHVVVKVLDIANTCWYVWSLDTFLERLDKMRRLSTVKGSYRAHLVLEPFHAHPAPRYSCIGTAIYPIWPGQRSYSAKIDAPVVDALSGLERGRVLGSLAALPIRNNAGHSSQWSLIVHVKSLHGVSETEMTSVHCLLRLARVHGLLSPTVVDSPSMNDQRPLSSQSGSLSSHSRECSIDLQQVTVVSSVASTDQHSASRFNSAPLSGFGDGPVNIHFRQQWTVDQLTDDTCVVIEFFGAAQPLALRRAFHEDVQIEQSLRALPLGGLSRQPSFVTGAPQLSASQNLLVERLHEEELFVDSQHELVLWIRVLELGLDGQWERAPCIRAQGSASFLLRQGLQRRVQLCIGHNTSQHLRIAGVTELSIGRPTLVDEKGRTVSQCLNPGMAQLPVIDVHLADRDGRLDNRCFVTATMPWDTSVYGSTLLDMPTDRGMCVRLAMSLKLEIENGEGLVELCTDIFAQVHSRQSTIGRTSGWLSALTENASEIIRSGIARISDVIPPLSPPSEFAPLVDPVFRVFSVTLSPVNPARGGRSNLWRLNTGKKYVRGEETLLPWQPRSVQFVDEFHRLEHIEAWRLVVARTREQIEAIGPSNISTEDVAVVQRFLSEEEGSVRLLTLRQERIRRRVLEAVRKIKAFRCVPDSCLGLQQEPIQASILDSSELEDDLSMADIKRLIRRQPRSIRSVLMQGHFCYHGWVDLLDTNAGPDQWARRWLVVERPYIFVYATKACLYLDNVINISSARISIDHHVSEMLGRQGVLALYTNTNAYLLCPPADELEKWISAIDNWFYIL